MGKLVILVAGLCSLLLPPPLFSRYIALFFSAEMLMLPCTMNVGLCGTYDRTVLINYSSL